MSSMTPGSSIPSPAAATAKRSRGRPRVYQSEEERKAARRKQVLKSVKAFRQRKKAKRDGDTTVTNVVDSAMGTEAELSTREGSISSSSSAVFTPYIASPSMKSPQQGVLLSISNDNGAMKDDEEDVEATIYTSATAPIEVVYHPRSRNKASFDNRWSPPSSLSTTQSSPRPSFDIPISPAIKNLTFLISSLLGDFLRATSQTNRWWPWSSGQRVYTSTAGKLLGFSNIAAYGACVARAKDDASLMRTAEAAYHDTVVLLRKYADERYVGKLGVVLAVMTNDAINYELSTFLAHGAPASSAWVTHARAGIQIMRQAGPDMFKAGFGAKVLLGQVPPIIMEALGSRQGTFLASSPWLEVLRSFTYPDVAYKDTLWPLAVQIPGIIQCFDDIVREYASASTANRALTILAQHVASLDIELDNWLLTFESYFSKESGAMSPWWESSSANPVLDPIFDTTSDHASLASASFAFNGPPIHFATVRTGEIYMLYWTYKLCLSILSSQAQGRTHSTTSSDATNRFFDTDHDEPIKYANQICRTCEYWASARAAMPTVYNCVSFPLRTAWSWFANSGKEYHEQAQCCGEISRQMRARLQGRVAEYVVDGLYMRPPGI